MTTSSKLPGGKNGKNEFSAMRRKIVILCVLFLLIGFVGGGLFGMFGMRHLLFRYRPKPTDIAMRRADEIQRDLGLSRELRDRIVEENMKHYEVITKEFDSMHGRMGVLMKDFADNVANLLDDPEKKKLWLETYENYFPRPPRGPLGPPPPFGGPRPPPL